MPWKKDLAKLKQDLGKEEGSPAKISPPPKPQPARSEAKSIEEEDNLFLSAMGQRPRPAVKPDPAPALPREAPPAVVKPQAATPLADQGEFSAAMGDLKGLKPLPAPRVQAKPATLAVPTAEMAPQATAVPAAPAPPAAPEPSPVPEAPQAGGSAIPSQVQIHLAAGMAIVVDGSLDLKGHARSDAEERLKERILDGYALGWRTLHVVVGGSEELRQMVLDLLGSPAGNCVARYAQAPVPMGGPQAWILYFRSQAVQEHPGDSARVI